MAKKTASAVQLLTISLIIFVMLTFVLAVTTYVFYAQKQDAVVAEQTAREATTAAQQKQREAEQAQQKMLTKVIGAEDGQTIDDLDAELLSLRDKVKGGGDENHPHRVSCRPARGLARRAQSSFRCRCTRSGRSAG